MNDKRKKNAPPTPAEIAAANLSSVAWHIANEEKKAAAKPPLHEALEIVQQARDLEVNRGRTAALPEGCFAMQRLLVAVLESMTPEQRAEVRRRLG